MVAGLEQLAKMLPGSGPIDEVGLHSFTGCFTTAYSHRAFASRIRIAYSHRVFAS
jgi:hypothetical protein